MARDDWMRGDRIRTDWRSRETRRDDFGRWDDAADDAYAGSRGRSEGRSFERQDYGQADYSVDYAYDPQRRTGYRVEGDRDLGRDSRDFGQADYSRDYGYDPENRRGFRRFAGDDQDYARRMDAGDYRREQNDEDRGHGSWRDRASAFFGGRASDTDEAHREHLQREEARRREVEAQRSRRRGPSDRVLWAVIVERLEDQRGLDLRDLEVLVNDGEVILNGTVKRKSDKRRIEDVADIDGVRNVQNNLRVRDRGWF
ncbi:BON domain-containing protein [Phenylobacterium deserti]|uniref:BON domain-containing protein n=1 Tax=Phenylobacterium deserti TaxID=1914756 RepID=A0A328ADK4_9CAUL|nr:BON domain-containing protein [Phenylobacterium deserti]RAK52913.1 hypothetical protein DJ018_12110 [Phenylobacterium deserti]